MKYLPFLLSSLPWAFLGLYRDIALHDAWPYLAAIAVPVLSGWYFGKQGRIPLGLAGSLFSLADSFLLTLGLRTDRWDAYFKPFGPLGLAVILWLAAFLIQALIWRHYRKDALTAVLLTFPAFLLLTWQPLCQLLALL